ASRGGGRQRVGHVRGDLVGPHRIGGLPVAGFAKQEVGPRQRARDEREARAREQHREDGDPSPDERLAPVKRDPPAAGVRRDRHHRRRAAGPKVHRHRRHERERPAHRAQDGQADRHDARGRRHHHEPRERPS
ncbi:MAG: hypothetical protein ACK55I_47740, partial [bacterium]